MLHVTNTVLPALLAKSPVTLPTVLWGQLHHPCTDGALREQWYLPPLRSGLWDPSVTTHVKTNASTHGLWLHSRSSSTGGVNLVAEPVHFPGPAPPRWSRENVCGGVALLGTVGTSPRCGFRVPGSKQAFLLTLWSSTSWSRTWVRGVQRGGCFQQPPLPTWAGYRGPGRQPVFARNGLLFTRQWVHC